MAIALQSLPPELQALTGQRILIIGNGPSATEAALGAQIDSFDTIVRINNYVTDGLESQVGSRTDIWVNGANQGLHKRQDLPGLILVMIPTQVLDHKGEAIHARIEKRLGTTNYILIPRAIIHDLETEAGLERPSTGFFCMSFFHAMGLDVTLHGFDFFVGSTAHYFDSPLKRWMKDKGILKKAGKHAIHDEKAYIDSLIQSGALKRLSDRSRTT